MNIIIINSYYLFQSSKTPLTPCFHLTTLQVTYVALLFLDFISPSLHSSLKSIFHLFMTFLNSFYPSFFLILFPFPSFPLPFFSVSPLTQYSPHSTSTNNNLPMQVHSLIHLFPYSTQFTSIH